LALLFGQVSQVAPALASIGLFRATKQAVVVRQGL
jgi:hypothetical protein